MAKNTVIIKNYLNIIEEGVAGSGNILPGYLVALQSDGKIDVHDDRGEKLLVMVAIEDALQGKSIDQKYTSGDVLRYWIPQSGDQFYAYMEATNIAIGRYVFSKGDGTVEDQDSSGASLSNAVGVVVGVDATPLNASHRRVIVRVI